MNRSILIVICDFLLVSLLAFSTVDINQRSRTTAVPMMPPALAAKPASGQQDLGEVMQLALNEERKNREQLSSELTRTRALIKQQEQQIQSVQGQLQSKEQAAAGLAQQVQSVQGQLKSKEQATAELEQQLQSVKVQLQSKEQAAAELERQIQSVKGQLQSKEQTAAALEQQIQSVKSQLQSKEQAAAALAQQQALLEGQFAAAQTNLAKMNEQLHASTVETVISKEQRAAMEAEARKQAEAAAALGKQLAQLQTNNQKMQTEQQALRNQLLVSEESNRSARTQISQLKEEVVAQRQQNVRLADGVSELATKSSELAREIREHRELSPNRIFEELSTNRVLVSFNGQKSGVLGLHFSKDRQTRVILVTDETNVFLFCHLQDTPLTLSNPGTQWEEIDGIFERGTKVLPIQTLNFCLMDPRVVLIPVTPAEASALGCKVYHLSKDPYLFQDAVVVGTRENYYGECKFQIDMTAPQYLRMDHNSLKGLFGKFNPSQGDLVLSKTGEFVGVMANNNYCAVLRNLEPAGMIRCGPAGRGQPTAQVLAVLYTMMAGLPYKVQ